MPTSVKKNPIEKSAATPFVHLFTGPTWDDMESNRSPASVTRFKLLDIGIENPISNLSAIEKEDVGPSPVGERS